MSLIDKLKILDGKIKANQAQYNLDKEVAKISALTCGELEKYEYLTGENLGYKQRVAENAKFEYYPSGTVFNKGMEEGDKKKDF